MTAKFWSMGFGYQFIDTQNHSSHNLDCPLEEALTEPLGLYHISYIVTVKDQTTEGHIRAIAKRSKALKYETTSVSRKNGTKDTCLLISKCFCGIKFMLLMLA